MPVGCPEVDAEKEKAKERKLMVGDSGPKEAPFHREVMNALSLIENLFTNLKTTCSKF